MNLVRRALLRFERKGWFDRLSDKNYLKIMFWAHMGKRLNLKKPITYNEKLQWLKLHDRQSQYVMMADKYAVREHIAQVLGTEYLIPLLGVWENPDDIDFDALPQQFVLKCNHNSGTGMYICKDKSKMNIEQVKKELCKGLRQDYHLCGREWVYKNIKRRIIAEKFMVDETGVDLTDYKVMCFNGEPKIIQIHRGRFSEHCVDWYNTKWELLDVCLGTPMSGVKTEKLPFLDEMLEFSQKLAAGIPHVRVDWYYVNGQLYFGELTFFNASGFVPFEPEKWDEILGGYIDLPK